MAMTRSTARPSHSAHPHHQENLMLKRLHLKVIASAGTLTALVVILEAGGKWS